MSVTHSGHGRLAVCSILFISAVFLGQPGLFLVFLAWLIGSCACCFNPSYFFLPTYIYTHSRFLSLPECRLSGFPGHQSFIWTSLHWDFECFSSMFNIVYKLGACYGILCFPSHFILYILSAIWVNWATNIVSLLPWHSSWVKENWDL